MEIRLTTERLAVVPAFEVESAALQRYSLQNRDWLKPFIPTQSESEFEIAYWKAHRQQARQEWEEDRAYRFCILREETLIGKINYSQVVRGIFQACYLGYTIDQQHCGQGFATEALRATNTYIFSEKNLHRIMANYLPSNKASAGVLRKLGFEIEGVAKNYLRIAGHWQDHTLTALTHSDWQPIAD